MAAYLGDNNTSLPDWVPRRPLLVRFMIDLMNDLDAEHMDDRGQLWYNMFDQLAKRESHGIDSVTKDNVKDLISQVAVACRASGGVTGAITIDSISKAFSEVCHRKPDEEAMQLMLRLPGLSADTPYGSGSEYRRFIDESLAEAAFGIALGNYILSPYHGELSTQVSWSVAGDGLGAEVAAAHLHSMQFSPSQALQALKHRSKTSTGDAIALDVLRVADHIGTPWPPDCTIPIAEVLAPLLEVTPGGHLSQTTISHSVFDLLDLEGLDDPADCPQLNGCMIGSIWGFSIATVKSSSKFFDCDISEYESLTETLDKILETTKGRRLAIALSILKKVYLQKGSARLGALRRSPADCLQMREISFLRSWITSRTVIGYVSFLGEEKLLLGRFPHVVMRPPS